MNTRLGAILIAGLAALLAAAPACADPGDGRGDGRFGRHFWLRGDEARGMRAERGERRHEFQQRDGASVRMSPEERRQLRHDIRAAREDVYRRPSSPPPPMPPVPHDEPPR